MTTERHTAFEELLDEVMLKESKPSHDALLRWSARYPDHRDALAQFFATWAVQETLPNEAPADQDRGGGRMVSQAMNFLYQQRPAPAATKEAERDPRLCALVKASGLSDEDFAARCGFDESMLVKLDRRRIHYSTIPQKCLERIAAALSRTVEVIQGLFAGDPVPVGANKSQGKPTIKTEDFLDAVRTSDLSEEAKAKWEAIVAADRANGDTK